MKNIIKRKQYLERSRKFLENKLSRRNLIKGINTGSVDLVRYSEPFLMWTRTSLNGLANKKLLKMHKALHPRDDIKQIISDEKRNKKKSCQH